MVGVSKLGEGMCGSSHKAELPPVSSFCDGTHWASPSAQLLQMLAEQAVQRQKLRRPSKTEWQHSLRVYQIALTATAVDNARLCISIAQQQAQGYSLRLCGELPSTDRF